MNIYIEIEVFDREFKPRLFLASYAALKNFNVYLMHRSEIYDLALKNKISPGIVFMKDANSTDYFYSKIKSLKSKGFLFTSQDEEAGILFEDYNNFVKRRFLNGKTFKLIDYFYCWGQRDRNILRKIFKSKKTQFLNVGSPRIDLLKKAKFSLKAKKHFLKKFQTRKYILIASNISWPIGIRRIPDAYNGFMSNKKYNFDWKENFFFDVNIQQMTMLKSFIRLIRYLLINQSDYDLILRPHPTESIEDWKKLIGFSHRKLKIIKESDLSDFILNSEVVIQNGCTSSIESKLLGKKVITFEPIKFDIDYGRRLPNNLGKICKTNKEVFNTIKNLNKVKFNTKKEYITELQYRLNYSTDKLSSEKIIESFEKLNIKVQKEDYFNFNHSFNIKKNAKKIVKQSVYKLLKYKQTTSPLDEKFPILKNWQILNYKRDLIQLEKKFAELKYEVISDRILKVSK